VTDDPSKAISEADAVLTLERSRGTLGMWAVARRIRTCDVPVQYAYFCIAHEALGMVGYITVSG
jgi:plastocyanin